MNSFININQDTIEVLENKITTDLKNKDIDINDIFFNIHKIIYSFLNGNQTNEKINRHERRIDAAKMIRKYFRKDIVNCFNSKCFLRVPFNYKCEIDFFNISFWVLKSEHVIKARSINFPIVLYDNFHLLKNDECEEKNNIRCLYFQNVTEFFEPMSSVIYKPDKNIILQKLIIIYECFEYNLYAVNPIYQILQSTIDVNKIYKIDDLFLNINIKKLLLMSPKTIFIKNKLLSFKDYVSNFLTEAETDEISYVNETFFEIIFKSFNDMINFDFYPFRLQSLVFGNCGKSTIQEGYIYKYETSLVFVINRSDKYLECRIVTESNNNKKSPIISNKIFEIDAVEGKIMKIENIKPVSNDLIDIS